MHKIETNVVVLFIVLDKPLDKADNLQNCPNIESQADKEKYRKITNFLKSMKTGAYPIKVI